MERFCAAETKQNRKQMQSHDLILFPRNLWGTIYSWQMMEGKKIIHWYWFRVEVKYHQNLYPSASSPPTPPQYNICISFYFCLFFIMLVESWELLVCTPFPPEQKFILTNNTKFFFHHIFIWDHKNSMGRSLSESKSMQFSRWIHILYL